VHGGTRPRGYCPQRVGDARVYRRQQVEPTQLLEVWCTLVRCSDRLRSADDPYGKWALADQAKYAAVANIGCMKVIRVARLVVASVNNQWNTKFGPDANFLIAAQVSEPDQ
jgi:hypothetical protein